MDNEARACIDSMHYAENMLLEMQSKQLNREFLIDNARVYQVKDDKYPFLLSFDVLDSKMEADILPVMKNAESAIGVVDNILSPKRKEFHPPTNNENSNDHKKKQRSNDESKPSTVGSSLKGTTFSISTPVLNVNTNTDDTTSKSLNAFNLMLNAAKKEKAFFSLNLVDQKLIPTFSFTAPDHHQQTWSTEVQLKQFKMNLGSFDNEVPTRTTKFKHNTSDRKNLTLIISTNIPTLTTIDIFEMLPETRSYYTQFEKNGVMSGDRKESESHLHPQLLKSMLQKSIRRRLGDKSVKLAAALAKTSLIEFLRRLPIICIEDASLHPALPIVVWLMVAVGKGYKPHFSLILVCLSVVRDLDKSTVQDCIYHNIQEEDSIEQSDAETSKPIESINNEAIRTILASLLIRSSYGGMSGDVRMLTLSSAIWFKRFHSNDVDGRVNLDTDPHFDGQFLHDNYLKSVSKEIWGGTVIESMLSKDNWWAIFKDELAKMKPFLFTDLEKSYNNLFTSNVESFLKSVELKQSDLVSEGIDFHIDSQLAGYVLQQSRAELINIAKSSENSFEVSLNLIERCIWVFRSSINMRKSWINSSLKGMRSLPYTYEKAFQEKISKELVEKSVLSKVWRIICPVVIDYCRKKISKMNV